MLRFFCLLLTIAFSTTVPAQDVVDNQAVIQMVQLKLDKEIIITKINSSATRFDTSPAKLAELSQAGVPNEVIVAMMGGGGNQGGQGSATVRNGGAEFAFLGSDGSSTPMTAMRVTAQISNRKSWIPVYGAFASPETYMFLRGAHAQTVLPEASTFVTSIDPLLIRLIELGAHKRGDRFVVFSGNSSDRERDFRIESVGGGLNRLSLDAALPKGEYTFLVANEIQDGMGFWGWFALYGAQAAKAYDFQLQ